jgi:hypothetical protein
MVQAKEYRGDVQGRSYLYFLFMMWLILEDCGVNAKTHTHCNKDFAIFPSPAGMSPIELSQDVKNLIIPGQGEFV